MNNLQIYILFSIIYVLTFFIVYILSYKAGIKYGKDLQWMEDYIAREQNEINSRNKKGQFIPKKQRKVVKS